jgi:hypothetical protein
MKSAVLNWAMDYHTGGEKKERKVYRYKMGIGRIEQNKRQLEQVPGVMTRTASGHANYQVPVSRGDIRKNSFAVRSVRYVNGIWNGLPEAIKTSKSCDQFKSSIKKWRENGGRPTR